MTTRLLCLDIDGTLTAGIGGEPLPGVVDAVRTLRESLPIRMVTNATSRSRDDLGRWLCDQGLLEDPAHVITPAVIARRQLASSGTASGTLLADEAARADFEWFTEDPAGPTVLLASECHDLRVADLQPAARLLLNGARLYSLQQNRYYRLDGELVTDLGPVAAFLAYAADCTVANLGKPSALMFETLAREVGAELHECLMVGDDAEFDVSGAIRLGLRALLVRTGKFRPGDETRVDPAPTDVLDSIADLPAWLARHP